MLSRLQETRLQTRREYLPGEPPHNTREISKYFHQQKIGDSWRGLDLCHVYTCSLRDGEAERLLSETRCETECGEEEEFLPSSTECCGRCVSSRPSCLLQDGTRLEAGRTVKTAGSACNDSLSCRIVNGVAVLEKSSQSCPPLPPDCPPASLRSEGCCQACLRCSHSGHTRNLGDFWKADSCTTCTCQGDDIILTLTVASALISRGRSSGLHHPGLSPPGPGLSASVRLHGQLRLLFSV